MSAYLEGVRFGETLFVEPLLQEAVNEELAIGMQGLLLAAYSKQYERGRVFPPLSDGQVRTHLFDPENEEFVAKYQHRLTSALESGSEYWLGKGPIEPGAPSDLLTIVKVTPSKGNRRQKLGLQSPNVFINDIVTHPEAQKKRLATMTLRTALAISRYAYNEDRTLALHSFTANSAASEWFSRLGLVSKASRESLRVGEETLRQQLFASSKGHDLRFALAHLDASLAVAGIKGEELAGTS